MYQKVFIGIVLSSSMKKSFLYLWILRCAGEKGNNRTVEYEIINEAPNRSIIPLVEVINEHNLNQFYHNLKRRYEEVWVDLPYYLAEKSNLFLSKVKQLRGKYMPNPRSFFINNKNNLDVPVVSAPFSYSFNSERNIYNSIKTDFDKIAIRVRVPTVDITTYANMLSSFTHLINSMKDEDNLLLDVFQFSSVESQVVSNIREMNKIARKRNIGVYILNAFETNLLNCHNYGPLLTAGFSTDGFGDFATDERFRGSGGRSITRTIRYYEPLYHTLWFFTERSGLRYVGAKRKLVRSPRWHSTSLNRIHLSICKVCDEVNNNVNKKNDFYWKRFKMLHYLYCINNETSTQFSSVNTPEDLDPDGYDTIAKFIGNDWESP